MSGLFGACEFDTGLAEEARNGLMLRMGERAAATTVTRQRTPTVVTEQGHAVALGLCENGCAGDVQAPHIVRADHLWLAFAGRLDHRDDLDRVLGISRAADCGARNPTERASDATVAMAAYRRFGIDCVDEFSGDWAFALWDARDRRLLLARDATGISSLFWWSGGGLLLFASSLPVLLAAGPVPKRPDPRWIAGLLTVFVDSAHPGATAFADVHALPPGHLVLAEKGRVDLRRWWRPESMQPFYDDALPELRERFRASYRQAVHALLPAGDRRVAATLSGGLDSGSLVALAAPVLGRVGRRLTAYVHTPRFDASSEFPTRTTDEWSLAQATARHVGNVDAVACRSEHLSPLDGIRQWLDMAVTPSHGAANWFWMLDIANTAALADADVLLVGQAGNSAVSYPGNGNLWPRMRRLQWSTVWSELRQDNAGAYEAFKTRLAKPALRPAYHGLKRAFAKRSDEPPWHDYALVRPELAHELGLREAMHADGHDPTFGALSPARRTLFRLTLLGGVENGASAWNELGRSHGLDVRDPTRDRKLVELCWRLPDELFWAQGLQRGLVRRDMRDALPPEVLACTQRGLQAADLRQRLQACRAEFLAEVERLCGHPIVRQWIDVERLTQSARATVDPTVLTSMNTSYWPQHLLRALAAAEFIARHA